MSSFLIRPQQIFYHLTADTHSIDACIGNCTCALIVPNQGLEKVKWIIKLIDTYLQNYLKTKEWCKKFKA